MESVTPSAATAIVDDPISSDGPVLLPADRIDENVADAIAIAINRQQQTHANWANMNNKAAACAGVTLAVAAFVGAAVSQEGGALERWGTIALIGLTAVAVSLAGFTNWPRSFYVGPSINDVMDIIDYERAPRSWLLTMAKGEKQSIEPTNRKRTLMKWTMVLAAIQWVVALAMLGWVAV